MTFVAVFIANSYGAVLHPMSLGARPGARVVFLAFGRRARSRTIQKLGIVAR
jgi:hypothetical protein